MEATKRKAAVAALITAGAIAIGAVSGGASSSTQAGIGTSPGTRSPAVTNTAEGGRS